MPKNIEVLDPTQATADLQHEAAAHALAVNKALGVTEYNPSAVINRLRGLMTAASQAMLEIGETLILVREHESAQGFADMLATVGMERRTALRTMQAARKFRLGLTAPQQAALQDLSRGTLLELLVLDDEDVAELAEGGSVLGLSLDDVATMSTSTLRLELRKARQAAKEAAETAERLLASKNEKIDHLETQVDKFTHGNRDEKARLAAEREANAIAAMQAGATELLGAIQRYSVVVADCLADSTPTRREAAESTTQWLFQRILRVTLENEIPVDFAGMVNPSFEV